MKDRDTLLGASDPSEPDDHNHNDVGRAIPLARNGDFRRVLVRALLLACLAVVGCGIPFFPAPNGVVEEKNVERVDCGVVADICATPDACVDSLQGARPPAPECEAEVVAQLGRLGPVAVSTVIERLKPPPSNHHIVRETLLSAGRDGLRLLTNAQMPERFYGLVEFVAYSPLAGEAMGEVQGLLGTEGARTWVRASVRNGPRSPYRNLAIMLLVLAPEVPEFYLEDLRRLASTEGCVLERRRRDESSSMRCVRVIATAIDGLSYVAPLRAEEPAVRALELDDWILTEVAIDSLAKVPTASSRKVIERLSREHWCPYIRCHAAEALASRDVVAGELMKRRESARECLSMGEKSGGECINLLRARIQSLGCPYPILSYDGPSRCLSTFPVGFE